MKTTFEQIVESDRFSMPTLASKLEPLLQADATIGKDLKKIAEKLSSGQYRDMLRAIVRHVFLIELVKVPKIETTKVRVRWYEQLDKDPRLCSFEDCLLIARDLIHELAEKGLGDKTFLEELALFHEQGILSYEAPIDYKEVDKKQIHRRGNLVWASDPSTVKTLRLRAFLTDPRAHAHSAFFTQAIDDKIKIKTYLTDRALTGNHKTNREKRWETHPESVQFATRRTCLSIEYALLVQLCRFAGVPADLQQTLQKQGYLPDKIETYCCPVTLEPMSFARFKAELEKPQMGKSPFQVGHLNPLKLSPEADEPTGYGHTADNIGWVSADGNRIQGHLSLADTRAMLKKIAQNYEARGWK